MERPLDDASFAPLGALRVVTPMLTLQWPSASDQAELLDVIERGIHDPSFMPFGNAWTDTPVATRNAESLARWTRLRQTWSLDNWTWCGAVRVQGRLVGVQDLMATSFSQTHAVTTGSWLGREFHGRGLGAEMRAAIVHLAFAGLDAATATSGYLDGNEPSRRIAASLGYVDAGYKELTVRGEPRRQYDVCLSREVWECRRRDDIHIEGLDACRGHFVPA